MSTARARVESLLASARTVFGPARDATLVDALVVETGLSRKGVEHALDHLLELHPNEAELSRFLAQAAERAHDQVVVVLAANVFTAPLRAIAWALAQSPRVLVRPSRRATTFLEALLTTPSLVDTLSMTPIGDDPHELDATLSSLSARCAVHAYGGTESIAAIASAAQRHDLATELHGPGFAAIVAESDTIVANADAIALDVAAFDQRGCLSPRIVFAIGNGAAAADALHRALTTLSTDLPRGTQSLDERAETTRTRDAATFAGRALEGHDHLVLDLGAAPGVPIGPVGRVVPVVTIPDADDALSRLAPIEALSSVAASPAVAHHLGTQLGPRRITPLGTLQSPPFDGPVDLRAVR